MYLIYHYYTCYYEQYDFNSLKLLCGDLQGFYVMLILVFSSTHWIAESLYFVVSYTIACYLMAEVA